MRLLLITQDFPPNTGGIETYCFELARRFYEATDHFAVLAPTHVESKSVDEKLPYPVIRVATRDNLLPLTAPIVVPQKVWQHSFDTVLHAQWQTIGASLTAQKLTNIPRHIYISAHARELLLHSYDERRGWISRLINNWRKQAFQKVDGFFPVSRYTSLLLKRDHIPDRQIHIISNGTDPTFFKPEETGDFRKDLGLSDKKVIFSVCRLVPRKGIDLVLHALQKIVQTRQDIIYLIGGKGADKHRLQALSSKLGLDPYVRFVGRIPNDRLPLYYSLADVFVMPARNQPPDVEGFGIVFLEANACGTPVIGSRTGGIPDAIIEGETGLLVDEDNVNQLVDALILLLQNEELAVRMGAKGRERVLREATWNHVAEKLLRKMKSINQNCKR